jgi:hypothetical protein
MTTAARTIGGKASNTSAGWDVAFWFAVLSPVLGILVGILAPLLFSR